VKPTFEDYLATLRWSIWHYDAPWWASRGIPDELVLPGEGSNVAERHQQALAYLATRLVTEPSPSFTPHPTVERWIEERRRAFNPDSPLPTLGALTTYLLDFLAEQQEKMQTTSTPIALTDQLVSLPWSTGIAAAYLLRSAGTLPIIDGRVMVHHIPFNVPGDDVSKAKSVDVFYDRDDARQVYLVHSGAHVTVAPATAFTGIRVAWWDVVLDVAQILHQNK
jgi:hypothetical protein